jgi:hypothetical protein
MDPPPRRLARHDPLLARLPTWEALADGLVLLEPIPLARLRRTVDDLVAAWPRHVVEARSAFAAGRSGVRGPEPLGRLEAEHAWVRDSLAELNGLLGLVTANDHGGNRQALGQYWRLLNEALRRHIAEEEALRGRTTGPGPPIPERRAGRPSPA